MHFQLYNGRLSLLNSQDFSDVALLSYEVFEIIQKVILRYERRKDADCVNVSPSEMDSEPVRTKDEDFGLLALEQRPILVPENPDLQVPLFHAVL